MSSSLVPPDDGDTWVGLTTDALPIGAAHDWCVLPRTGAVVLFSGVVRDHATDDDGVVRSGVQQLEYEAYESQVVPSFTAIADEVRRRWPSTGRVVLLHRIGLIGLGESSVVAAVSTPHRSEAFEAAHYAIDALKSSAPIWKREEWQAADGTVLAGWGTGAHDLVDPVVVGAPRSAAASTGFDDAMPTNPGRVEAVE